MTRITVSDGSTWPRPALESDENYGVGHGLRYAGDLTQAERMEAAAIIDAYGYLLVEASRQTRELVAREVLIELNRQSTDSSNNKEEE